MSSSIVYIFILSLIISSFEVNAQKKAFDQAAENKKRLAFENTLDSLFLKEKFERIIDLCNRQHPDYLQPACDFNLIGTYYFLGDSAACWKLLNKEIAEYSKGDADAYALSNLLSKDYTSYRKFLQNSTAKNYILSKIDSIYLTEPVSDKENGIKLLHLLIEDQWVRNTSSLYDHFKPERRHLLPSQMDSTQAIQAQRDHSTSVFNFYRTRNKVFSKAEVGRIYYWQLSLFFHEWDLARRNFYHELVKQGVENGILSIENQANFEVGTEYIIMGVDDFFKHREEIQEKYRKKYSLPNYRIRLM